MKIRKIAFKIFFCFFMAAGFFIFSGAGNLALAAVVGEQINFFVDSAYDSTSREQVSATLRTIGQRGYFYVEDQWWSTLTATKQSSIDSALINLSRELDQVIYPKMTSTFGAEWNPGIDNDPRLTILITKTMDEAGGYFSYTNEYPKSQFSDSNEREMIYLNSLYADNPRNASFIAHEFQHLITFYQKQKLYNIDEDIWLNEARSEYSSTLLGYDSSYSGSNLERRVKVFLSRPSDSLAEWRNELGDYGVVNLFMQYLVEHYGEKILTLTTQSNKAGIDSINYALQSLGYSETFNDVFARWAIANFINNCGLDSQKSYCYINSSLNYTNLHIDPTSTNILGQGSLELATWLKDWSPRWYKIDSGINSTRPLQIKFEGFGSLSNFKVPYILKTDNNSYEIHLMPIDSDQKGSLLFSDFGSRIKSIILIPINMYKKNNFSSNEPNTPFSLRLTTAVSLPNLYNDGSLVLADNGTKVYLIENGTRRWIASAEIFIARGYKWADIQKVSSADLGLYPDGKNVGWPSGSLIKSNLLTVYVISEEKKRAISSAEIFLGLGYEWKNIKTISQQELDQYQLGALIVSLQHPNGSLVRFSDSSKIYLIENGQKRWIPSVEIFLAQKYVFDLVVVANPSLRNQYPDGINVF